MDNLLFLFLLSLACPRAFSFAHRVEEIIQLPLAHLGMHDQKLELLIQIHMLSRVNSPPVNVYFLPAGFLKLAGLYLNRNRWKRTPHKINKIRRVSLHRSLSRLITSQEFSRSSNWLKPNIAGSHSSEGASNFRLSSRLPLKQARLQTRLEHHDILAYWNNKRLLLRPWA